MNELNTNEEKVASEYVVNQFKDCKTLRDFQDKYKEIELISITHMPLLGQRK